MAVNSHTVTLTGATEDHSSVWTQWFSTIVVTVDSGAADPVYVRTDGTAAVVGAAGTEVVNPGTTAVLGNEQPEPDYIAGDNTGTTNNTYVSLISGAAATVTVAVE